MHGVAILVQVWITCCVTEYIVLGINEDSIQQRLLAETTLTLKTALKIAQAQEIAMKGCVLVGKGPTEESAEKEKVYADVLDACRNVT